MLNQLHELATQVVARPVSIAALGHHGGYQNTPGQALSLAIDFAAAVVPALSEAGTLSPPALETAADLFRFIADLPDDIRKRIALQPGYGADVSRAWEELDSGEYTLFCALVQDVWEHALGPERQIGGPIRSFLERWRGLRVLDFGSGAGHHAMGLAANGCEVTCVEPNGVKAAFLRYRSDARNVGTRVWISDRDTRHHAALALNVFDHLQHPHRVIPYLASRLQPGGTLLHLTTFPRDGWHQSDPTEVLLLSQALTRYFRRAGTCTPAVPFADVLARRSDSDVRARLPASSDPDSDADRLEHELALDDTAVPRMRSNLRVTHLSGRPGRLSVTALQFDALPCFVDSATRDLLMLFDGRRSIADVAGASGVEVGQVNLLVSTLRRHRLLDISAW